MAVTLYDISIEGSLLLTAGTQVGLSVDFTEVNNQAFTINSATVDIYDADTDTAVSAIGTLTGTVTTGLRDSKRCVATLTSTHTTPLSGQYYAIWTLTLSDNQTRKAKQSIEFRSVS